MSLGSRLVSPPCGSQPSTLFRYLPFGLIEHIKLGKVSAQLVRAVIRDILGPLGYGGGRRSKGSGHTAFSPSSAAKIIHDGFSFHFIMITTVRTICNPRFAKYPLTLVSMNTLNERVRAALAELTASTGKKHTPNWLSIQVGISRTAVYKWVNDPTAGIDGEHLVKASKALGVRPEWLSMGRGPMRSDRPDDFPSISIEASSPEDLATKLSEYDAQMMLDILQMAMKLKDGKDH